MEESGFSVDMVRSVIHFPKDAKKHDLIHSFARLRKNVFVDDKRWQLFHADDLEFEQYDGFDTTYVIAHRNRRAIGGARLRRTDQTNGVYSYMIRDAWKGMLSSLPQDLTYDEPPVDQEVWELTRLAVAENGRQVTQALLRCANNYLYGLGAKSCLFLGPPAFLRMSKQLGWIPIRRGPLTGNHDGKFLVFECYITAPEDLTPIQEMSDVIYNPIE